MQQHQPEDQGQNAGGCSGCKKGSEERAERGGDLQKHSDPNVRVTFTDERRGGPGRGCNHRYQAGPDGVPNIHAQQQRERRRYHYSTAQARQRAQASRHR